MPEEKKADENQSIELDAGQGKPGGGVELRRGNGSTTRKGTFIQQIGVGFGFKIRKRRRDGWRVPPNSPTYSFDTVKSTVKIGTPIPVIYGHVRIGGNVIQAYERGTAAISEQTLYLLLAIGWGELYKIDTFTSDSNGVSISSLKINEEDGAGVSCSIRLGGNDQTILPETAQSALVGSVDEELLSGVAETYTTSNTPVFVEFAITFDNGLMGLNERGGFPFEVEFEYEIAKTTDATVVDSGTFTVQSFNGAQFTYRYRSNELPGDTTYDVSLTRLTQDEDDLPAGYRCATTWDTVDEIGDEFFSYPNIALLELKNVATSSFNGIVPNISLEVHGRKVLTYDGASTTTEYSNNPAWVALDILLNPLFGLGRVFTTDKINLDSFKVWADYCDEIVDGETRHEFNGVFDFTGLKAWEAFLQVCDLGRATPSFLNGQVAISVNSTKSVTKLITDASIQDLNVSYKEMLDTPDEIVLTFFNEAIDFQEDTVGYASTAPYSALGFKSQAISRLGITRLKQAVREARYVLLDQQAAAREIRIDGGKDLLSVAVGDLVIVGCEFMGWCEANGRTQQDSGIYLDKECTLTNGSTILVEFLDGSIEERTITNATGDYEAGDEITVDSAFSSTINRWDKYVIYQTAPLFEVAEVTVSQENKISLVCYEYQEAVHTDDAVSAPAVTYTSLPKLGRYPDDVEALAVQAITINKGDGTRFTTFDVFWDYAAPGLTEAPRPKTLEIYIRENGDSFWQQVGTVEYPQAHFPILKEVTPGLNYDVAVVPVSANGDKKNPGSTDYLENQAFTGDTTVPDSISSGSAVDNTETVNITFNRLSDESSIEYYETRLGDSWQLGEVIQRSLDNSINTTQWHVGENSFHIRPKAYSGKYAVNSVNVKITKSGIGTHVSTQENHTLGWTGTKTDVTVDSNGDLSGDGVYTGPLMAMTPVNPVDIRIQMKCLVDDENFIWSTASDSWENSQEAWEGSLDIPAGSLTVEISIDGGSWVEARKLINQTVTASVQARITTASLLADHTIKIKEMTVSVYMRP